VQVNLGMQRQEIRDGSALMSREIVSDDMDLFPARLIAIVYRKSSLIVTRRIYMFRGRKVCSEVHKIEKLIGNGRLCKNVQKYTEKVQSIFYTSAHPGGTRR
jgi:hypothetical protein